MIPDTEPELEVLFRRYLGQLASTPMPSPDRASVGDAMRRHRSRATSLVVTLAACVVAVALAAGTLFVGQRLSSAPGHPVSSAQGQHNAPVAAVPTPCTAASYSPFPPGLTGAALAQAIQAADQHDQACSAAWWANLDLSAVDWAAVPHTSLAASYAAPDPALHTLGGAVGMANTIVVARVVSIGKGAGVVFHLAVDRVVKGVVSGPDLAMVDEGSVAASDHGPPSGFAIVDAPGVGFPTPGQEVVVFGSLVGSTLHPELYTGLYFVSGDGTVSALPMNPFASTVSGTRLDAFVGAIESAASAPATSH